MSDLGRRLCLKLVDNRSIGTSSKERRTIARVVLEQGKKDNLVSFGQPDDHIHLHAGCSERAAGRLAQRIESSLKQRLGLGVGFQRVWNRPLNDGRHPASLARYYFKQAKHHQVPDDPLFESTNLPDLLGLRLIGGYTADNFRRWVRRFGTADLLRCLGVGALVPRDGDDPLALVLRATLAASALPDLRGRGKETVAARRALVAVVGERHGAREVGDLIGITQRRVYELRRHSPNPALVRAIRLQLDLIHRVGVQDRLARPFHTVAA